MTPEDINLLLHRPLKKGVKYDHLMPFSDCSSILLATGDTKEAINQMVSWSLKYKHHTKTLADTVFRNYPLTKLCKELHQFLFSHLQYKIDGYDQKLRSPACSWSTRSQGIDCKSYSIFASTVLLNLGVSHYLRRVVYDKSKGFSHVYVVIPKNQNSNNLKEGYYTIDATVKFTDETPFVEKDDAFVKAETGLGASAVGGALMESAAKAITVVADLLIQGFLNELLGCDDAAYELPIVQLKLKRDLQEPLKRKLDNLIHAISINNAVRIEHLFNTLFKEIDLGIAHLRNETAYSQRNECIAQTLLAALAFAEELKKVVDIFYLNFTKTYSHFKITDYLAKASVNQRTLYFVVENDTNPIMAEYRLIKIESDKSKYGLEPIFGFRQNKHEWLNNNTTYLKNTYKDGREKAYKKEITPILNEVVQLRSKYVIGGEMLYYFEQPLQTKMNTIWLTYDDQYAIFLGEKIKENVTANKTALAAYTKRYSQTIEENKRVKKRKKDKIHLGIGLTIAAILIAINPEEE